jgi:hypothetical protein
MQHVTAKNLARACCQMSPIIERRCGVETADALAKICDERAEVTRSDAIALATALLLELRSRASSKRR